MTMLCELGGIDGGAGATDLVDVAVTLLDGTGVGVLESFRSAFCSCGCFTRTPFLIVDAKHLPSDKAGDSSTLPLGKCLEQTGLLAVTESSDSQKKHLAAALFFLDSF